MLLMKKQHMTIATRQSPLALWQAHWVKKRLEVLHPGLSITLLELVTTADRFLATPLVDIGGKGLFVKELEEALLSEDADIAVHSMKDVPMVLPEGLCLPIMCEREDPRDVFVSSTYPTFAALPKGADVGTASLRRQSQLLGLRRDLHLTHLRGNVNTRLQRLAQGEFAAIILAAAGLKRLGFTDKITQILSIEDSLPAPGQGVLGIECREHDELTYAMIAPLQHEPTYLCVTAERAMCRVLGGGCRAPVAAYAEIIQQQLYLRGLVARVDGSEILRAAGTDELVHPDRLGKAVAADLLQQGANAILNTL